MSSNYYTPFVDGPSEIMNAALLNGRLGTLDAAIASLAGGLPSTPTGVAASRLHAVYALGDSLTSDGTYVARLLSRLGAGWAVRNCGISGNTTTQMLARLQTHVLNAGDGELIVVLGGINDIAADASAATIESNLQAIYTAAAAAGLTVIACTITPFKTSASWSSGRQTVLDAVNTWILNTATGVDYRIDTFEALEDGSSDTLVGAYDSGDHLHLSAAGYNELADTVYEGATWTAAGGTAGLNVSGTVSLNQPLLNTSSPTFQNLTIKDTFDMPTWKPLSDGTSALQIANAAGSGFLIFDTTNLAVGLGTTPADTTGLNIDRRDYGAGDSVGLKTIGGKADASGTNSAYGLSGYALNYALSADSICTQGIGVQGVTGCYAAAGRTATLTTGYALKAGAPQLTGDGTKAIGSAYGLIVENQGASGVTGAFGIYIAGQSGASDNYAFYSESGKHLIGSSSATIGFYGVTPIARAVLATGAGATVDNVITALQALGLVKQS